MSRSERLYFTGRRGYANVLPSDVYSDVLPSDVYLKIWRLVKAIQSRLFLLRDNIFIYHALFLINNFADCLHWRISMLQTAKQIFFKNPYDLLFKIRYFFFPNVLLLCILYYLLIAKMPLELISLINLHESVQTVWMIQYIYIYIAHVA